MEISDDLLCLFTSEIEDHGDSYTIEVPAYEVDLGTVESEETYRVALLSSDAGESTRSEQEQAQKRDTGTPTPPVTEGEIRELEIEDIGEQGDGIARVERGYVVIVADANKGDQVSARVTDVRENVAFAEIVD